MREINKMIICIQDGYGTIRTLAREQCEICHELSVLEDGEIYSLEVAPKIVDNVIMYLEMKYACRFEQCGGPYFDRLKQEGMFASVRGVMQSLKCHAFEQDIQRFATNNSVDKLRSAFKNKLKL
jgi:hypothetical protein